MSEHEYEYFSVSAVGSYFMLVNTGVLGADLPAVTLVAGSTRVQSVNKNCGLLYHVLTAFKKLTGVPILLTTSFNGPGEPVIESAKEAINFLIEGQLDAVFFEGRIATKKQ
jgi:carbamoyltransferase